MLNELSGIARDLLGLHGYPVAPVSRSMPQESHRRERVSKRIASASRKSRCNCARAATIFFGSSRMGHVYW